MCDIRAMNFAISFDNSEPLPALQNQVVQFKAIVSSIV
jgi:hypothetical protein